MSGDAEKLIGGGVAILFLIGVVVAAVGGIYWMLHSVSFEDEVLLLLGVTVLILLLLGVVLTALFGISRVAEILLMAMR